MTASRRMAQWWVMADFRARQRVKSTLSRHPWGQRSNSHAPGQAETGVDHRERRDVPVELSSSRLRW